MEVELISGFEEEVLLFAKTGGEFGSVCKKHEVHGTQ